MQKLLNFKDSAKASAKASARFCKILQDSARFYKILQYDTYIKTYLALSRLKSWKALQRQQQTQYWEGGAA